MSETSGGATTTARQHAMQDFAIRYRTAVSASLASLASTTVGYVSFCVLLLCVLCGWEVDG